MTYTTDYCKNFLISQYPTTKKADWKRTKKYKDANGSVYRDFLNSVTQKTVTIKEMPQTLINYTAIQAMLYGTVYHGKRILT